MSLALATSFILSAKLIASRAVAVKDKATVNKDNLAPVLKPSTLSLALPRLALNSPASSPSKTANLEIIAIVIYLEICPF